MTIFGMQPLSFVLMVFFFGFCVFIHELGHLLAALWRNLHVERFSIGFGNAIWKKTIKGVEYRVSWIPFGGYVALPQLEPTDTPESFDGRELPEAKPLDRIITAFAGPLFNILFAFFIGAIIWQVGIERPKVFKTFTIGEIPATYEKDGEVLDVPEYKAGLRVGDKVVAVNGIELKEGFPEARTIIVMASGGKVTLDVVRAGEKVTVNYNIVSHPNPIFRGAGIPFFEPSYATYIRKVSKGSPADKAGLKEGDTILKINGAGVINPSWVVRKLQALNPNPKEGGTYNSADFLLERDGKTIEVKGIVPVFFPGKGDEEDRCIYGVSPDIEFEPYHPTPWEQCGHVFKMMGKTIKVISDKGNPVGMKAMSGPVGIANVMKKAFDAGFLHGLNFVVMISFSLAIFNLLPIPILDGGHITLAAMEMIMRRKVPARMLRPVFYLFLQ